MLDAVFLSVSDRNRAINAADYIRLISIDRYNDMHIIISHWERYSGVKYRRQKLKAH